MSNQSANSGGLGSPGLQHSKKPDIVISLKMFAFEFGSGRNLEIFNGTITKISGCTLTVKWSNLKK